MGFGRDTDIGRVAENDVTTGARIQAVLERLSDDELSDEKLDDERHRRSVEDTTNFNLPD